jgi:GNAT superfamily N-acetyltransferase
MAVELRPMRDDEFAAWLPLTRERYAADMVEQAGVPEEQAAVKAADDVGRLFPGDDPSEQQLVYVLEADGEPAGVLWLCQRDDAFSGPCLFVYNIEVDEPYRGRGYGRAAMEFAEDEARRLGVDRIALNVFGRNEVARGLYRSLGYEENAVAMSKKL